MRTATSQQKLLDVRVISRCVEEAEVNAIAMSPTDTSVAQFIHDMLPIHDDISVGAIDDAPVKIIIDVIVHQEDEVDEAQEDYSF